MAKGYDRSKERKDKVSLFGKRLAKRSKSKCELCEDSGVPLKVYEIKPVVEEPNEDRCIFLCETCIDKVERLKKMNRNDLSFLNNSVWSEVEMVKTYSVALLRDINKRENWADDILEMVYLTPEEEEIIESIEV